MHKNFDKKLMKSKGVVLDNRSTKGEVQFLAVKISSLRSSVCDCQVEVCKKIRFPIRYWPLSNVEYSTSKEGCFGCRIFDI